MSGASAYCTARTIEPIAEDSEGLSLENEMLSVLQTFDEVIAFLEQTYDRFSSFLIEQRAFEPEANLPDPAELRGFGVRLVNRRGGMIEVGVGRDVWFLHRFEPRPSRTYSTHPEVVGTLVSYLDGWHSTELGADQLVSRPACLAALSQWLDTNRLPVTHRA